MSQILGVVLSGLAMIVLVWRLPGLLGRQHVGEDGDAKLVPGRLKGIPALTARV